MEFPSTQSAVQSQETHRIYGIVIDSQSAEVLAGVKVVLDDDQKITYTNFDGEFELEVYPGLHKISVTYLSYESVEFNQSIPAHTKSIVISLTER
ncbi:MAG: carboxypeptidase-like regulatory domain-containing protein [Cyclobacteriaceae bacterium]|nr:carboxypeptidase-like regulatory domain-containing protein [Cyclobacteriaceae bacterium]